MQRKKIHIDVFLGILLTALSGYFLYQAFQIHPGSAQFPKFVLGLFLLLSAMLLTSGIIKVFTGSSKNDVKIDWKNATLKSHIVYGLIVLFVVMMVTIGFFPALVIWCPIIMFCYGIRNIKILAMVTLCLSLFIYVLFVMQLKVQMP